MPRNRNVKTAIRRYQADNPGMAYSEAARRLGHRDSDPLPQPPLRAVQPLRKVEEITYTGRTGTSITPHNFWLDNEFRLTLVCGHALLRVTSAYATDGTRRPGWRSAPLPVRARCPECDPVPVRAPRVKPVPVHDAMAVALFRRLLPMLERSERHALGDWLRTNGGHITDEGVRHAVYGRLGLALVDIYAASALQPLAGEMRAQLAAYLEAPTPDALAELRRRARSFYRKQHHGGSWYANRGMISALAAATSGATAPSKVLDATGWFSSDALDALYAHLTALRHAYDASVGAGLDGLADGLRGDMNAALKAGPHVSRPQLELLRGLLATYTDARAAVTR